jgi:hypothetical protein
MSSVRVDLPAADPYANQGASDRQVVDRAAADNLFVRPVLQRGV